MAKRRKLVGEIGPLTQGADGWYRDKTGTIIIAKGCPETWYRKDEPGTQDEQWADLQRRLKIKAILALVFIITIAVNLYLVSFRM